MDERAFDDEPVSGTDRWIADGSSGPFFDVDPAPKTVPPEVPGAAAQREIQRLTEVARAKAAAVAVAEAELVDAVAALKAFEGQYDATWRQWVSWQCGLTSAEAARICRLAENLAELPRMDEAFRAGRLSAGVTDVLARDATPATEEEILAVAEVATGKQLEQLVRDHRQVRRNAKPPTPADDAADPATAPSELSYGWGADGRHRGHWDFRADDGATLEAALEAALAHLRPSEHDIDAGRTDPSEAGDTGDDDEDGDAAGDASGIVDGDLRPEDRPRIRRSDALVALANTFLAGEADDGLLPESTQIILHRNLTPTGRRNPDGALIPDDPDPADPPDAGPGRDRANNQASPDPDDPDTRERRAANTDAAPPPEPDPPTVTVGLLPTTLPGCGTLDPRIAELLACDALVITVDMIAGFPVSEPSARRTFNRAERRALRARDRHCRYPGCRATRHLHAHHTKPFACYRRTTIADAVLLCGPHHRVVHLRGLTIDLGPTNQVTITRPDGSILRGAALPPPATIDPPPVVPPDRRLVGTHEPLTTYARDVIVEHWLATEPPAEPTDEGPPAPGPPGPEPPEPSASDGPAAPP